MIDKSYLTEDEPDDQLLAGSEPQPLTAKEIWIGVIAPTLILLLAPLLSRIFFTPVYKSPAVTRYHARYRWKAHIRTAGTSSVSPKTLGLARGTASPDRGA
jgi:hypothetical protein